MVVISDLSGEKKVLLGGRPYEKEKGVQDVQLPEGNPMLGGRLSALTRYELRGGNPAIAGEWQMRI